MNPNSDTVVLGRYSEDNSSYTKVAANMGATYYDLDMSLYRSLTPGQRWQVNEEFLKVQLLSGKEIVFSHDPNTAPSGGTFAREVNIVRTFYGPGTTFEQHGLYWKVGK